MTHPFLPRDPRKTKVQVTQHTEDFDAPRADNPHFPRKRIRSFLTTPTFYLNELSGHTLVVGRTGFGKSFVARLSLPAATSKRVMFSLPLWSTGVTSCGSAWQSMRPATFRRHSCSRIGLR